MVFCEVDMMKFTKKGSELSMNMIIIAAIALLVLVILAVMLLNTGNDISDTTGCAGLGGKCCSSCGQGACQEGGKVFNVHNVAGDGSCDNAKCCISVGGNRN